ncbi:MAG: ABC transporter substrate-binding protein [Acidimicrobiales bacterium]
MVTTRSARHLALGVAAAIIVGACSGGSGSKATPATAARPALPPCPLGSIAKATKPVQLTFWHALVRANEETLQRLVNRFNGSQTDIKVNLVNQTSYGDDYQKFLAGLSSGDLPDLVQIEDIRLQQMIDTRAVLPAQSCIDAEHYDTSDFLPRVTQYYSQNRTLYPMPFNVSNPVLYYDRNAFTKAGLDPDKPPASLDEVKAAAQKIKAAGYKVGFALKLDPWYLEQWSAKAGADFVDNGNGRTARATKAIFDGPAGQQIFGWMSDMVHSGLASTNSASGPSAFDNLLAIRSHDAGMTIDTSAALGTITQVLASGQGGGVSLGVGAMPGPTGQGGVLVGGAALYISRKSPPEKQEAAWVFSKFLDQTDSQAEFAAGTGYIPLRKSSIDQPAIQKLWATNPGYRVAYDQLAQGVENSATAGPVIGDYQGVRDALLAAEQAMFTQGLAPGAALTKAQSDATAKIQDYNARVS